MADGGIGAGRAIAKLRGYSARLNDTTPAMSAIKVEVEREISAAFANQRSPAGKQWKATKHGREFDPEHHLQEQIEVVVDSKNRVFVTGPDWLRAHMSGGERDGKSNRPPKRNPLPMEKVNGRYDLNPRLSKFVARTVKAHVIGGG